MFKCSPLGVFNQHYTDPQCMSSYFPFIIFLHFIYLFLLLMLQLSRHVFGRKPFSAPTRVSLLMWKEESDKWNRRSSPCHDDKEIQPVPRVPEVTASTKDPQSDHFYNHLHSKEDVDERIEGLTEKKQRYEVLIRENIRKNVISGCFWQQE